MNTDELRELNAKVHLLLTGDDGSCFAPDGTARRIRIYSAVKSCNSIQIPEWTKINEHTDSIIRVWQNREGQPWQASLEAHVKAYRADPPDYAGDWRMCMGDGGVWPALREMLSPRIGETIWHRRFDIELKEAICDDEYQGWYVVATWFDPYEYGGEDLFEMLPREPDGRIAVCRAYVAACETAKKDEVAQPAPRASTKSSSLDEFGGFSSHQARMEAIARAEALIGDADLDDGA